MSTGPSAMVVVDQLQRSFGEVRAVNGVSFQLPAGSVCGFIGANGAGKTTTLRLLATLDQPDGGVIRVGGFDAIADSAEVRRLVGWMPDHTPIYNDAIVIDYLDFFARAHRLRGAARQRRLDEIMSFTDLHPLAARPLKGLSKGQLQRLGLARMLLPDPQVLLLDEPAAGLDPKARLEFKAAVRILKEQGKTLLISSHILSELEEMCDGLLFIDAGRIVHHGTTEDLRHGHGTRAHGAAANTRVRISLAGEINAFAEWLALQPGWTVREALSDGLRAELAERGRDALARELRRIVTAGHPVCGFQIEAERLEDVFVSVLQKVAPAADAARATQPPPLP